MDTKFYSSKEVNKFGTLYHILQVYQTMEHESKGRFNANKAEVRAQIKKVENEGFQDEPIFKKVIADLTHTYNLNTF